MEVKQYATVPLMELKLAGVESMSFTGYGAAFGNVDSYGDVIAPGAFSQFLADMQSGKQAWPSMLSQHGGLGLTSEDMTPIGAWTTLSEDGKGLISAGDLAATQRGKDMHTLMSMKPRPAIDGLSIGFIAKKWDARVKPEDPRRTLREIALIEISPVTFPANRNARLTGVKSLEEFSTLAEIEDCLRDVGGFSHKEAKTLISRIKKLGLPDAGLDNDLINAMRKNINILKKE